MGVEPVAFLDQRRARRHDVGENFGFGDLFGNGGRHDRSLVTFCLADTEPFGPDLAWLAERVARGELDPQIAWRASWEKVDDAIAALLGRRLHGKAVIELTDPHRPAKAAVS